MKLNRPKFQNFEPKEFPNPSTSPFDVCELKYDGWWAQLLLEGTSWEIYSRTGMLKKSGWLCTPIERTLLHGEFIYGTEWAKDHPEYYNCVMVHSAEMINGLPTNELSGEEMRQAAAVFLGSNPEVCAMVQSGVFMVPQWTISEASSLWATMPNFEGLVFKTSTLPWGSPFGRMKRCFEMDYICMGFEQSKVEKFKGRGVASIIGGLYFDDKPMFEVQKACLVSGLTDEQRRMFFERPKDFIGQVFTANGKKISKKGALRHPNFVRFRDDKPVSECTWPAK